MNLKTTLQEDNAKLDLCRRQLDVANVTKNHEDIETLTTQINELTMKISDTKAKLQSQLSEKAQKIVALKFNRALSKAEQADMGKLKKSVRGLMVVHPMTALGKEIGVEEVTGYAHKPF
ncbi:YibL family ribosome-associated protein [Enterovibrio makurazakiensis]|uniref:YibL family ribosome-associated protein n=1 Tax=Enterovibrio gelatinilyticus TaxID=2899819 RepID=A0ABT5QUK7_9GAMM|nr:YibL family ribosome-associated protein [Enterovibrio sp. ZSDZ42]MDD1791689.1 YibL family ribosome-associated protein [Enterovibrio sp. ZSDZ42]